MPYDPEVEQMFAQIEARNGRWNEVLKKQYESEVSRSAARHERMAALIQQKLRPGQFLLFIDMVESGVMGSSNIAAIKTERLKLLSMAQTGMEKVSASEFQSSTMRHMLGLKNPNDSRMKTVKAFEGRGLPENLSECAGVILSGSEANLVGPQSQARQVMVERVMQEYLPKLLKRKLPMFGICFGSEAIIKSLGGQINYIDTSNPKSSERGLVSLQKTLDGQKSPLLASIPENELCIHESHSQQAVAVPEGFKVLASSNRVPVQIGEYKENGHNILTSQGHPEALGSLADVASDLTTDVNSIKLDSNLMFTGYSSKTGEALFKHFLESLNANK